MPSPVNSFTMSRAASRPIRCDAGTSPVSSPCAGASPCNMWMVRVGNANSTPSSRDRTQDVHQQALPVPAVPVPHSGAMKKM